MDAKKVDYIGTVMVSLLILIAYFSLFKVERTKIRELKRKEKVLTEKLDRSFDTNQELSRISSEIDHIREDLESFDRRLPGTLKIYDVIRTIDGLARKSGLQVRSIRPGSREEGRLYSRVPITISLEGAFPRLYRFLYQLEKIPRITRVEEVSVHRSGPDSSDRADRVFCHAEMVLSLFVGKE